MDRRGHPAEDNRALKLSAAPWLSGWPAASHQPGPRGLPFQKGDLRAIEGLIAPGRLGCHVDKAEESSWRHRRRVSWLLRVVQVRALVTEAETHTEPLSLLHPLPKHPPVLQGAGPMLSPKPNSQSGRPPEAELPASRWREGLQTGGVGPGERGIGPVGAIGSSMVLTTQWGEEGWGPLGGPSGSEGTSAWPGHRALPAPLWAAWAGTGGA